MICVQKSKYDLDKLSKGQGTKGSRLETLIKPWKSDFSQRLGCGFDTRRLPWQIH